MAISGICDELIGNARVQKGGCELLCCKRCLCSG